MKTLIIYAHPNPKSFNHAIADHAAETLRGLGHEVRLRDLYALKFNPVLDGADFDGIKNGAPRADVAEEQSHLSWAEQIIITHPVWWYARPAILQGYIDRVLSNGFAYKYTPEGPVGLLKLKKALVFQTTGTPAEIYEKQGVDEVIHKQIVDGVLQFCGIPDVAIKTFYAVPTVSDGSRHAMLDEVKSVVERFAA